VDGPELSVANGGAGTITASGRVTKVAVDLSGTGSYKGRDLASQDADVSIGGAGEAVVNASGTLNADITGIGSVSYVGSPSVTRTGSGIGEINKAS
jgi:Putative auto-transporter adhesin, head GIN domain